MTNIFQNLRQLFAATKFQAVPLLPEAEFDLSLYEHPEDPRIIRTNLRDVFYMACTSGKYDAALLDLQLSPEERHRNLLIIWSLYKEFEKAYGEILPLVPVTGMAMLKMQSPSLQEIFISLKRDFEETFAKVQGNIAIDENEIFIGMDLPLQGEPHTHSGNTMNITYGAPYGTGWINPKGKKLYANEGEYFWFKSDFRHFSPDPVRNIIYPRMTWASLS